MIVAFYTSCRSFRGQHASIKEFKELEVASVFFFSALLLVHTTFIVGHMTVFTRTRGPAPKRWVLSVMSVSPICKGRGIRREESDAVGMIVAVFLFFFFSLSPYMSCIKMEVLLNSLI